MTARQALWEFLDSSTSARIIDTADEGLDDDYFSENQRDTRPRWRVALGAGVALVGVVVLVAVGAHIVRQSSPVPQTLVVSPGPQTSASEAPLSPRHDATVIVHIAGAVNSPGVIELPVDSRIIDALAKAGGPTPDALLDGVNLARILFDGEQIVVPALGDERAENLPAGSGHAVSLSRASQAELETLPRIGPATAQRIIAWREAHGPFRSVDDVLAVSGIGPATLEGIRALVAP